MVEQLQLKDIAYQAIWLSWRWKQLGSFAIQRPEVEADTGVGLYEYTP